MRKELTDFKIKESVKEIQGLLENCSPKDYAKLQFLLLVKEGENISYSYIKEILGVSSRTLTTWKQLYEKGDLNCLLENEILKSGISSQETNVYSPVEREQALTTIQNRENNISEIEDMNALKEWIADNYVTKNDFVSTVNNLNKVNTDREETINILKRIVKLLSI